MQFVCLINMYFIAQGTDKSAPVYLIIHSSLTVFRPRPNENTLIFMQDNKGLGATPCLCKKESVAAGKEMWLMRFKQTTD